MVILQSSPLGVFTTEIHLTLATCLSFKLLSDGDGNGGITVVPFVLGELRGISPTHPTGFWPSSRHNRPPIYHCRDQRHMIHMVSS